MWESSFKSRTLLPVLLLRNFPADTRDEWHGRESESQRESERSGAAVCTQINLVYIKISNCPLVRCPRTKNTTRLRRVHLEKPKDSLHRRGSLVLRKF